MKRTRTRSKIQHRALIVYGLLCIATVVLFQNCGDFAVNLHQDEHWRLASGSPTALIMSSFNLTDGSELGGSMPFEVAKQYSLVLEGEGVINIQTVSWSLISADTTAACSLNGESHVQRTLNCSGAGNVFVRALVSFFSGSNAEVILSKAVQSGGPADNPNQPNTVRFKIPAGTGSGAWNTPQNPAVAFKGQILRIINEDALPKRLHTPDQPCAHQTTDIRTGEFFDCLIGSTHSATATDLYDHNSGTSAIFYLLAIDGAAQYNRTYSIGGQARSCASCHGNLATSAKRGRVFEDIRSAIDRNAGGMGAIPLSENELRAIAYELSK